MKTLLNFTIILCSVIIAQAQDLKITNQIASSLKDTVILSKLHYPKSVMRFYAKNNSEYAWIHGVQKLDQPELAMLLLEYSYRFGLPLSDYHLETLSLEKLRKLRNISAEADQKEKALFDVLMTDALITFINNLHFGKYNPLYNSLNIDTNAIHEFRADDILLDARQQTDFLKALEVQPKIKAYTDFQDYLNVFYTENDCMDSHPEIEKIMINMERLRWIDNESKPYILINIPSYTLELYQKDAVFDFKVIVGKPTTRTPVLESRINYFTTAPDWKVPQSIFVKEMLPKILKSSQYLEDHHYAVYDRHGNEVEISSSKLKEIRQNPYHYSVRQSSGCDNALGAVVFRFPNSYGVYLHDTSQKQLFNQSERALSHGCIRVEKPKELASLLLRYDGAESDIPVFENAMAEYKRKDFVLKQPVPVVITYLTCLIKDGKPVLYKDIYHFDDSLENKFNLNK
ncbi:L,D-transpeptidase family protein [Chryseobacterium limigenitum]|uniref:L,D-transpeptidase catalytic domain n=1 Tax=Chryseobacterium limigenitum TaxID=1612149 RepID=A0A1K2IJ00_9FLAO|nr:L,D-transpeptidase family protein [Chryseobacterium limigenitum]SFZ92409.1 L,D-transpeptidase catalytic domain [Chryseobacterium limigenitum]